MENKEERYANLLEKLKADCEWPAVYMFKFIVPSDNEKLAQVENLFDTKEAEVRRRQSSKGNYVSITATEMMLSAEKVIERYREAEAIEGIISL